MCGITAYCGDSEASKILLESLERLEYRGYDSAGIAVLSNPGLKVEKGTGEISDVKEGLNQDSMEGNLGVGHTRWATHGDVSRRNAHPHTSCDGRFALVHNGIIENWKELKAELEGHKFKSETDSEVIAHYIEEGAEEKGVEGVVREFMNRSEGSFAVVLLDSEEEAIYAFKSGSPLALGIRGDETFLGSDIYAFSPYTSEATFFEDGEYAVLKDGDFVFRNSEGETVEKEMRSFDWDQEESGRGEFDHYMRKEIGEIPEAMDRLERSLETTQGGKMERMARKMRNSEKVIFTASGTSYHASLLGVYLLQRAGIEAQALIASEFKNYERVDEETLLIAVSQSGETKDVLDAVEYSKGKGAEIASMVNVPHSSIERKSSCTVRIKAGQEVCVAATKTFTNQLYAMLRLAGKLGYGGDISGISGDIRDVIEGNEETVKELVEEMAEKDDVYIIGRGETYPVAREIALKLKEISYIHAEGMMGGELKHGTLALVEEGTPVVSLIPDEDSEIRSNVKEVEARGAKSIPISSHAGYFDIPRGHNGRFVFFSTIIGFLISYWTGRKKGLPIDKPRNLAKSVTVK